MFKALKILSITLLIFLVSCETENIVTLNPISDIASANKEKVLVSQSPSKVIPDEYIVIFKEDLAYFDQLDQETNSRQASGSRSTQDLSAETRDIRSTSIESYLNSTLAEHKFNAAKVISVYDLGRDKGGLVSMTKENATELAQDDQIAIIEPNEIIAMGLTPEAKGHLVPADDGPAKQVIPYNIEAVGGKRSHRDGRTWAFIIDSGIDMDHPELYVEAAYSKSFVPHEPSPDDGFGHGTHVAGIIGAKNDGKGVVGVASGAPLVAYKVIDSNGYGTKDYLVQALIALQSDCLAGDVVNLSLGTDNSALINGLITNLQSNLGIYFTIASGNQGIDAANITPANLSGPGIYVVGAIDNMQTVTTFSNFGKSVNFLAPGTSIYSTYKNGQYAWLDGTSMAAPHLAGILLVNRGRYKIKKYIKLPSGNYAKVVRQK